jgi:hypothetical protein
VIEIKGTSIFLICLLVSGIICGVGAALLWYSEGTEDLEYYGKMRLDDKFPHRINTTLVDDKFPHRINTTPV